MAIGFTPKHTVSYELANLNAEQFLALTIITANALKFQINYVSESGMIAFTNRGIFRWNALLTIVIDQTSAKITSESTGNEMIDFGKNKRNVQKFLDQLDFESALIKPDELDRKTEQLKVELQLTAHQEDLLKLPPATTKDKLKDFISLFIPSKELSVTPVLADLNILTFVVMIFAGVNIFRPDPAMLLAWGANFRPLTLNGEGWRLFSSLFVHIGIVHLVMNMFALLFIGFLLEPILGKTKFLVAYLLAGVTAGITSIWWHDLTISAGASGAVFGLYGVFLSLLTTDIFEKSARKALLISIGIFVIYNLLAGMKEGVDNAAHIGGLLAGILIGFGYIPAIKRTSEPAIQWIVMGFLSFLFLGCASLVYFNLPNNSITNQALMQGASTISGNTEPEDEFHHPQYEEIMNDFHSVRVMAMDIFPVDTTSAAREKSLSELKDRGIYYWQRSLTILDQVKELDLPPNIVAKNNAWRAFCSHQMKCYQLMYKAIDERSKAYDTEIQQSLEEGQKMMDALRNMP